MFEWFREGGVVMYPVLVIGLVALVAAGRHASEEGIGFRAPARTLQLATAAAGLAGTLLGTRATLMGACAADPSMFAVIMSRGIGEAIMPLVFALVWVGLGSMFVAAGDLREAQKAYRRTTLP